MLKLLLLFLRYCPVAVAVVWWWYGSAAERLMVSYITVLLHYTAARKRWSKGLKIS